MLYRPTFIGESVREVDLQQESPGQSPHTPREPHVDPWSQSVAVAEGALALHAAQSSCGPEMRLLFEVQDSGVGIDEVGCGWMSASHWPPL